MDGPSSDRSSQEAQSPSLGARELPRKKQRVSKEQEKGEKDLSTTDGASSLVAPALSARTRQPETPLFDVNYKLDDKGGPPEKELVTEADGGMRENPKEDGEHSSQLSPDFKKLLDVLPLAMVEKSLSDGTVQEHSSVDTPAVDGEGRAGQDNTEDGGQSKTASVSPGDHSQGYAEGGPWSSEADVLKRARYYILSMERERKQLLEENRELRKRFEDHNTQQDKSAGA
ncbi:hypothetical protein DL767_001319 [Monosporascus sp. MG133]|nr:hypothetical protein DL767_001319 [Monosporascus sp. MG133]